MFSKLHLALLILWTLASVLLAQDPNVNVVPTGEADDAVIPDIAPAEPPVVDPSTHRTAGLANNLFQLRQPSTEKRQVGNLETFRLTYSQEPITVSEDLVVQGIEAFTSNMQALLQDAIQIGDRQPQDQYMTSFNTSMNNLTFILEVTKARQADATFNWEAFSKVAGIVLDQGVNNSTQTGEGVSKSWFGVVTDNTGALFGEMAIIPEIIVEEDRSIPIPTPRSSAPSAAPTTLATKTSSAPASSDTSSSSPLSTLPRARLAKRVTTVTIPAAAGQPALAMEVSRTVTRVSATLLFDLIINAINSISFERRLEYSSFTMLDYLPGRYGPNHFHIATFDGHNIPRQLFLHMLRGIRHVVAGYTRQGQGRSLRESLRGVILDAAGEAIVEWALGEPAPPILPCQTLIDQRQQIGPGRNGAPVSGTRASVNDLGGSNGQFRVNGVEPEAAAQAQPAQGQPTQSQADSGGRATLSEELSFRGERPANPRPVQPQANSGERARIQPLPEAVARAAAAAEAAAQVLIENPATNSYAIGCVRVRDEL
ncbi:MAG: hypothetical protein M1817_004391 [Caeruleum heppii]|nr:MAG: hypothetical protein M1817_004391 [Caeruleum heppii]